MVIDRDVEGLDVEDIAEKDEIEKLLRGYTFCSIDYKYYNNN